MRESPPNKELIGHNRIPTSNVHGTASMVPAQLQRERDTRRNERLTMPKQSIDQEDYDEGTMDLGHA